jgi:neutral ceramidase
MARALVYCWMCACLYACGVSWLEVPAQCGVPPRRDRLWVGLSEVDITPPIGLGLFGHGPESRISTGIALRLRCQVFVFSATSTFTGGDELLALVPCELPAASLYLQRAIADYVAKQHVPVTARRIALMATHTHFGPGHFLASDGYTGPFSARRTGLDQRFVELLAKRIGDAIVDAYWHAQPARIGWAYRPLSGLARNRSVAPFLHNKTLPPTLAAAIRAAPDRPDLAAVDPTLSLLRIDQWDVARNRYAPAGLLAFYGVHPSVVNNQSSLYTGDLFGYATRRASELIRAQCATSSPCDAFVVGLANGIEGDVTSLRAADTHREARRLGEKLGGELAGLWSTFDTAPTQAFDTAGPFAVAYRELQWSGATLKDGRHLCEHPGQGTPAGGGAADHPTTMQIFAATHAGVHATADEDPKPCGWPRYPLIGIDPKAAPGANYPHVAPILLARIGRGTIATAPAELTTVVGTRIRDELQALLPAPSTKVTMVGLTNEYLGYIATRDEYQLQHYEGASTLYGPDSARFLSQQFGCLAKHMARLSTADCALGQPEIEQSIRAPYKATRTELLPAARAEPERVAPSEMSSVVSLLDYGGERVYRVWFKGPAPSEIQRWEDLTVEVWQEQTLLADGRGTTIRIAYDGTASEARRWSASWVAPTHPSTAVCGAQLRFAVATPGGVASSAPFRVDCTLPEASGVWP